MDEEKCEIKLSSISVKELEAIKYKLLEVLYDVLNSTHEQHELDKQLTNLVHDYFIHGEVIYES